MTERKMLVPVLETLAKQMEERGYFTLDGLGEGDTLVVHAGGQDIGLAVVKQGSHTVMVSSAGPWSIATHFTEFWGTTLHFAGMSMFPHRIAIGCRLVIDSLYTPPVERVTIEPFTKDPAYE